MSRQEKMYYKSYAVAGPSKPQFPPKTPIPLIKNGDANKKPVWKCKVCAKELSSKRSYTEHMNIHNKSRPFQCEHCDYAAASQMTLHRHKLRNHTPKTEWGYRCPYCDDAYMEPAGYQQHVQHRHAGHSATYGCPYLCKFTSKSQRHFREHIVKHKSNEKVDGGIDPCSLSPHQLVRYLINDECGVGADKKKKQLYVRTKPIQPLGGVVRRFVPPQQVSIPIAQPVQQNQPPRPRVVLKVDERREPKPLIYKAHQNAPNMVNFVANQPNYVFNYRNQEQVHYEEEYMDDAYQEESDMDDEGPPILDPQQVLMAVADNDWVQEEVEVESIDPLPKFHNGFCEEALD